MTSITGAGHRIADQPFCESRFLQLCGQTEARLKRCLATAISDKFQSAEQPASPNVPDMGVRAQSGL